MLKLGLSLIGVLVLLWVLIRFYRKFKAVKLGLTPRKNLMDKLVREFKHQLDMAVGDDYEAHSHVRLADLLVVETAKGKKALDIRSRIETTSTDLVLTERATGNIACVLILIHQEKLGSRQKFIREICQQSKLPFQIFDVNNAYSEKQIRQEITMLLEPTIRLEDSPAHEIKIYLEPEQRRQQEPSVPEQSVPAQHSAKPARPKHKKPQSVESDIQPSQPEPAVTTDQSVSAEPKSKSELNHDHQPQQSVENDSQLPQHEPDTTTEQPGSAQIKSKSEPKEDKSSERSVDSDSRPPQREPAAKEQGGTAQTKLKPESEKNKTPQQAVETPSQSPEQVPEQDKSTYASHQQPNKKHSAKANDPSSDQQHKRTEREAAQAPQNKQDDEPEFDLSVD